ncbi:hypothetical protein AAMO2058_000737500 [Amorphochlora amoebiformis]
MESEWVDGVWGGELPTVVENKDSRASRPSSPVPSKEATLRIEGLRERMRKRARKSSAAAVDVRPLQAANLLGKQGMGLSETRNTPLDEEKLDALVPTLSSKRVCLIGQTLKNDNPENQNGDIKGLVRLKEIDLQLEGLQTCHRCGKRGKQGKLVCKSQYCSLNGKRVCICAPCVARWRERMPPGSFKTLMGNIDDPNWHCPRCVDPHFLPKVGICCCSFHRLGLACPWHREDPKLCCSSARVSFNSQKRRRAQSSTDATSSRQPKEREQLCKYLDKVLEVRKIVTVRKGDRCYVGFPCRRAGCNQRNLSPQPMYPPSFISMPEASNFLHVGIDKIPKSPVAIRPRCWPTRYSPPPLTFGAEGLGYNKLN